MSKRRRKFAEPRKRIELQQLADEDNHRRELLVDRMLHEDPRLAK